MKQRLIFIILAIVFFALTPRSVFAQGMKLELADPAQQIAVGDTFQVKLLINTGGVDTINADALLLFESAKVAITDVVTENFYTYFSHVPLSGNPNQYLISSWEESVAHAKSSTADTPIGILSVKANAVGSTTLSFVCTPGTEADSNINRASDSQDILSGCSGLTPLTLTIGTGGTNPTPTTAGGGNPTAVPTAPGGNGPTSVPVPTSTPTPTFTPTPTSTPRPTATPIPTSAAGPTVAVLPRAGAAETTVMGMGMAALLLTVGAVLFML